MVSSSYFLASYWSYSYRKVMSTRNGIYGIEDLGRWRNGGNLVCHTKSKVDIMVVSLSYPDNVILIQKVDRMSRVQVD